MTCAYGPGSVSVGWWFLKAILFAAGCLIFSVIFWATSKWFDKKPIKRKK